jgi:hypothetical protein
LAYFAVFGTVNNHGFVSGAAELRIMSICDCETYCLTTEPITLVD